MTPIRVQRKRTKGYKLPENTVCVNRPSKWSNPFKLTVFSRETSLKMYAECISNPHLVYYYFNPIAAHNAYIHFTYIKEHIHELKGKNLACFCPIVNKYNEYVQCHADILLSLANNLLIKEIEYENLRKEKLLRKR
jgi:hypothetical protein